MQESIQNPKRVAQLKESVLIIGEYKKDSKGIENTIRDRNLVIRKDLNVLEEEIAILTKRVKLSIKKDQDRIGTEVAQLNKSIQTVISFISIIILIILVLLSIIIPKIRISSIHKFQ
ncbi:MAG: hypothetical protein HRT42_13995 [Campylobacteraceae bacterium]|nr:hypothetical protein [Campylobacteraceae bacterium]